MKRFKQIFVIAEYLFAVIVSLFKKNTDWIISERGKEARDNGSMFFLYIKKNHPNIKCKYVIDKNHRDYKKLTEYKNDLVQYGSFEHFLSVASAKYLVSSHFLGCQPYSYYFATLNSKFRLFRNKKNVFLQHGIIKDDIPMFYSENTRLDLFICGSSYEYEYVKDKFHYKNDEVKYTGLCRFDNLLDFNKKKMILIMPTWRKYIDDKHFMDSDYFCQYKELLTNVEIQDMLSDAGYTLVFYPHYEIQKHILLFKNLDLPAHYIIASFEHDVQTLLKEASLMITDYSSVYFDMVYMHKPVLFFQFDEIDYRKGHYKEGYFNVESIGPKYTSLKDLSQGLYSYLSKSCQIDEKYLPYIDEMFKYRDKNNCQRVFDEIVKL